MDANGSCICDLPTQPWFYVAMNKELEGNTVTLWKTSDSDMGPEMTGAESEKTQPTIERDRTIRWPTWYPVFSCFFKATWAFTCGKQLDRPFLCHFLLVKMKHGSCPAPPSTGILFKHRRRRSDASFGVDFLLLSCSWHSRKHLELMELMELMELNVCRNCPKKLVPEGVGISPKTYFTRHFKCN
jgi:hypothetical protein